MVDGPPAGGRIDWLDETAGIARAVPAVLSLEMELSRGACCRSHVVKEPEELREADEETQVMRNKLE